MATVVASTGALLVILCVGCSPGVQEDQETLDATVAASDQGGDRVLADASSSSATLDGRIVPPADVRPGVDVASSIDGGGVDTTPTVDLDLTGRQAVLICGPGYCVSDACLDVVRRGREEVGRLQTCGGGNTCTTTILGTTRSALFPGSCCGLIHRTGANLSTVEALAGESAEACGQILSCSCGGPPPPVVCREGRCRRGP